MMRICRSGEKIFMHARNTVRHQAMAPALEGFTLVEIVVCLVILGVLAATAVPKFIDISEETEKKAVAATFAEAQARIQAGFGQLLLKGGSCAAARQNVGSTVFFSEHLTPIGNYVLGAAQGTPGGALTQDENAVYAWREDTTKYFDGTLYLPVCNAGSKAGAYGMGEGVQAFNFQISLMEALTSVGALGSYVDSGAGAEANWLPKVAAALNEAGIDLRANNINSWSYNTNGWLHWSEADLNTVNAGDQVLVMRYNPKTSNYTVMYAKVSAYTDANTGKTYNIIGSHSSSSNYYQEATYNNAKMTDSQKKSFEEAKKFYDAVKQESGMVKP